MSQCSPTRRFAGEDTILSQGIPTISPTSCRTVQLTTQLLLTDIPEDRHIHATSSSAGITTRQMFFPRFGTPMMRSYLAVSCLYRPAGRHTCLEMLSADWLFWGIFAPFGRVLSARRVLPLCARSAAPLASRGFRSGWTVGRSGVGTCRAPDLKHQRVSHIVTSRPGCPGRFFPTSKRWSTSG